jgi:hypothetical protein
MDETRTYTAFLGHRIIGEGDLDTMLENVKQAFDADNGISPIIFEDWSGRQVDFDLRGPLQYVLERAQPNFEKPGRGRPKLGVIPREVTLLARHWEWLESQPSGASAALRRLVDEAVKNPGPEQRIRAAREAAGRALSSIAGDLPGYEEATRALYQGDREGFMRIIAAWPEDVRIYSARMAEDGFARVLEVGA